MNAALNLPASRSPRDIIAWAWQRNRPITAFTLLMLGLAAIAVAGVIVDPRIITGAPAWMKPLKFAVSIAIYSATLLWLLTFISDRPRLVKGLSWAAVLGFGAEMALIVLQVLRGTTSHFNNATPFDAAVFQAMGGIIAAMWLLNAFVLILLARRRFAVPPIAWAARFGLAIALVGMAVAFLMPQPTPEQEALMDAGGAAAIVGAHTVGAPDGGPGLPVVGWSTTGGDLRVAHFFGLHALQALPLFGGLLLRFTPAWLKPRDQARLVVIAGAWWLAMTLLLAWQALRAQPLIAPDNLTLVALAAIAALAGVGMAAVVMRARGASGGGAHVGDVRPAAA